MNWIEELIWVGIDLNALFPAFSLPFRLGQFSDSSSQAVPRLISMKENGRNSGSLSVGRREGELSTSVFGWSINCT